MTNKASSFPAAPAIGPLHRYGGKITALGELPIHALGDSYTLDGSGTIRSLPSLPPGMTISLTITGTPTFVNSSKLICQNGANYTAGAGDFVVARSKGDGVWQIYVLPAATPAAPNSIKGNNTAVTSVATDLTPAQIRAMLRIPSLPRTVATHTTTYNGGLSTTGTNLCMNTRSSHFTLAAQPVSSIEVGYANFVLASSNPVVEADNSQDITVRAALEYPSGTYTPLWKNGARDVLIKAGGGNVFFDPCGVSIPANTQFWVRTLVSVASTAMAWPLGDACVSTLGEGAVSASSYTDDTTTGTITANGNAGYAPVAIFGLANAPGSSVLLLGDSILDGTGDVTDASGNIGYGARAIGTNLGYVKFARASDALAWYAGNNHPWNSYRRNGLIRGRISHAICQLGVNDVLIPTITPLSALEGQAQIVWTMLASMGAKVYQCTITPATTSTDNWATTGNQTVTAQEAMRTGFNDYIRTVPSPLSGYFETADIMETARNSGIIKVTGSAFGYTTDGIHPSQAMHALLAAAINPGALV